MAKTRVSRGRRAPKAGAETPVAGGIQRATKRAGLTQAERYDSQRVTFLRGDLNFAALELQTAFDDLIRAEFFLEGGEHDTTLLSVLRRVRNAPMVIGGAS